MTPNGRPNGFTSTPNPDPRPNAYANGQQTVVSGAQVSGTSSAAASGGGISPNTANGNVTICMNGSPMTVPANQVNSYLGSGASVGPCGGGGSGGNTGSNGGGNGGGSYGNGGGTVGYNGGTVSGGTGYNGGGGVGYNSGNAGFNNTYCGYNGGGWTSTTVSGGYCPPNQIATSNVVFYNSGNSWNCTPTYYNYGYNYYRNYSMVGFSYRGICNGVSYELVYPDLEPGCNFVAFYPYRNKRVSILESACGTFHWRVVERRSWVPGAHVWYNGSRRWSDGFYTWRVVRQTPVYDYWDCVSCYW